MSRYPYAIPWSSSLIPQRHQFCGLSQIENIGDASPCSAAQGPFPGALANFTAFKYTRKSKR
jgi:hypothetical protein